MKQLYFCNLDKLVEMGSKNKIFERIKWGHSAYVR